MKILKHTEHQFDVRFCPWGLWLICTGFIAFGLWIAAHYGRFATAHCERHSAIEGICQLSRGHLWQTNNQTIALSQISGTRLVDQSETLAAYQLQLLVDGQNNVVVASTWNDRSLQTAQTEFDQFLNTPLATQLSYQYDSRPMAYAGGGAFVIVGLAIIGLMGKATTWRFDKQTGWLQEDRRSLWSHRHRRVALSQIEQVVIEQWQHSKGTGYRVTLFIQSEEPLHLPSYYDSGLAAKQQTAEAICQFLELPPVQYSAIAESQPLVSSAMLMDWWLRPSQHDS